MANGVLNPDNSYTLTFESVELPTVLSALQVFSANALDVLVTNWIADRATALQQIDVQTFMAAYFRLSSDDKAAVQAILARAAQ